MRAAFVGMQGRIDPPSSLGDLTVERLSQTASEAEVWVATTKAQTTEFGLIAGTVILTPKAGWSWLRSMPCSRRLGFARSDGPRTRDMSGRRRFCFVKGLGEFGEGRV